MPSSSRRTPAHLLRSKLVPPQLSVSQVHRTALVSRICSPAVEKLVLIQAPAGFGKTTLMLQARDVMQRQGVRTAWLNADAADNDVGRFLAFLAAAVATLTHDGQELQPTVSETSGLAALELLDRIAEAPDPFVLFIDDLEAIQSTAGCSLLQQVIEDLPAHGRVIIGARIVVDLGIAKLRAQGQVLDIQAVDLRFSLSEAEDFLQTKRGLALQLGEVARLQEVTEGWPVALGLASLALSRCEQPSKLAAQFSGSNLAVAEYLAEEILAQLSPQLREFMVRTSILGSLSAKLCDAVLGIDSSAEALEELERAGLLIQPASQERDWFRYHSLFGDFLRTQLARLHSQELPQLHRAAARWYEAQRRPIPAIEHALAAGDLDYALPLLDQHAEQLLQDGRSRLLGRLLESAAADLVPWPRLRLIHVWVLSMTHGGRYAMSELDKIGAETLIDEESKAHALSLRPTLLTMVDRFDAALETGQQALDMVPPSQTFAFNVLRTTVANLRVIMGRYSSARELLDKSQSLQQAPVGAFMISFSQCVDGVIDLLHGRLQQATARFREANVTGASSTFTDINGNAMAGLLLAEALYEQNELAHAERLLNVYVPLMLGLGLTDHLICGHRNLARIAFHRGDRDRALQLVTHMEFLGNQRCLPRLVASAQLERARFALWDADLQAAREALQRARATLDWREIMDRSLFGNDADTLLEGQARWLIHSGAAAQAVPELKQELERADTARRLRRALRLRILLALALDRSGNEKQALRTLRTAVRFGQRERFVRTFLDEGELGAQLLRKLTAEPLTGSDAIVAEALPALEEFIGSPAQPQRQAATATDSAEAMTRKEVEILHLVAEGLSNLAIAERLFVSVTTVRSHLRSINAKLGVHSRTQAVAVARRSKLIG